MKQTLNLNIDILKLYISITLLLFICFVQAVSSQPTITKIDGICFGSFAVNGSTGGTITVHTDGSTDITGGITQVAGITPHAASFTVSGTAGKTYKINSLLGITCTTTDGTHPVMTVNNLISNPVADGTSYNGLLNGGGTQILYVGGILTIPAGQAAGTYSGGSSTFTIFVTFNY